MSKSRFLVIISSLSVVVISMGTAVILVFFITENPVTALNKFFTLPFSSLYNIGNVLSRTVYFSLCGAAICLAFRSGFINLGGEGQVYTGALCAVLFWLFCPSLPKFIGIPLGLFCGGIGGFLLGGLSSLLKNRLGIEELLSSFLISGAAVAMTDTVISSFLQDEESFLMATSFIQDAYRFKTLFSPSPLTLSILFPVFFIGGLFVFFKYTITGRKMELTGRNRELSGVLGFPVEGYTTAALGGSGFLLGFTGALAVSGIHYRLIKGFSSGWGWNGITITLMAGNNPLIIPFSAFLLAYLEEGGRMARIYTPVSLYISAFIQSVILMLITSKRFSEQILSFLRRRNRV